MTKENINQERELLFHYTKFDTALFHILPVKKLLMNPIAQTNDIYEMQNSIDKLFKKMDWFEKLVFNSSYEYLKRNKLKLLCFSKEGEGRRGFDNSLMWSFYGDNYQGICLVFNKSKLVNRFGEEFRDNYSFKDIIDYEYKIPSEIESNEEKKLEKEFRDISSNNLGGELEHEFTTYEIKAEKIWQVLKEQERYKDLFFRKGEEWIMENEYRFVIFDTNHEIPMPNFESNRTFLDYGNSLVSIVLGPSFRKDINHIKIKLLKDLLGKEKVFESRFDGNRLQIEYNDSGSLTYLNYEDVFKK